MSTTPTDNHDLLDIERLAQGQDAGLDSLMERYAARLLRYLLRLVGDEHEAEEVAQETFVRVYRNHRRFDRRQRFSSWIYAIATNLARDRLRRRQRHAQIITPTPAAESGEDAWPPAADPGHNPRESLLARETGLLVRDAILALPEALRIPMILSEYDGLAHIEISEILDCTPKAVEMRLYRARQILRAKLAPLLEPRPIEPRRTSAHNPHPSSDGLSPLRG